ncbi:MAG TPA: hypothetical protein VLS93_18390 [Anaeromyxobacteraceae bacterium]|nr:hypothetical protein [Anaeromyxobacteraceae bacterium]
MVAFAGLFALAALSGLPPALGTATELRLAPIARGGGEGALAFAAESTRGDERAPACSGEVCQPIVAVPGFEPRFSIRGKRTELTLRALEKARLEPFATVAFWLAAAGLRLDYTPPQLAPGSYPVGYSGWGRVSIWLRWRIDATGVPVFPRRRR